MLNQNNNFIQGCWRLNSWDFSDNELLNFIYQLLDLGVNCFDHADIYGDYSCEAIFGRAMRLAPQLRHKINLTSKCGIKLPSSKFPDHTHIYDTSYQHIIDSVNRSLVNLSTDYLDLLLIHRPDPLMDPEEVARAFEQLKQDGKVLNFGVSNFLPHQFELLQAYLDFPLQTNQIEVSVIEHQNFDNGTINHLHKLKIRPQVWSPLGGGSLFTDSSPANARVRQVLSNLADKYNCKIEQIATAWLLCHPIRFQILLGSSKIDRIRDMLDSQQIELSRNDWFQIWIAQVGHDIP